MHSLDLERKLAASLLDHVEIDLIPACERRELGPRKLGERAQVKTIDGEPETVGEPYGAQDTKDCQTKCLLGFNDS